MQLDLVVSLLFTVVPVNSLKVQVTDKTFGFENHHVSMFQSLGVFEDSAVSVKKVKCRRLEGN